MGEPARLPAQRPRAEPRQRALRPRDPLRRPGLTPLSGAPAVGRVVALGASNLTLGLGSLLGAARATWGREVELLAALGLGRSYGARSTVLVRSLPGILDSGLWDALEARPSVATRGLVTDVGNDILYGYSPEQTLAWVDEAVRRLARISRDVVVTDLPLASIRRLSRPAYLFFRTLFAPSCRLPLEVVLERCERLHAGLGELAAARGARLCRLRPSWYGVDPIHIRPRSRGPAWRQILGVDPAAGDSPRSRLEGPRLLLMPPERQWLCGVPHRTPQPGTALRRGGRVWLY